MSIAKHALLSRDVLNTPIKVSFKNESGDDFGGLTREMFTAFWTEAYQTYFHGEPTAERHPHGDDFYLYYSLQKHSVEADQYLYFLCAFYLLQWSHF